MARSREKEDPFIGAGEFARSIWGTTQSLIKRSLANAAARRDAFYDVEMYLTSARVARLTKTQRLKLVDALASAAKKPDAVVRQTAGIVLQQLAEKHPETHYRVLQALEPFTANFHGDEKNSFDSTARGAALLAYGFIPREEAAERLIRSALQIQGDKWLHAYYGDVTWHALKKHEARGVDVHALAKRVAVRRYPSFAKFMRNEGEDEAMRAERLARAAKYAKSFRRGK